MIGVSKDASGEAALRMALQTREQHIRRGKATSNICTAQVLPGIVAAAYAVYHGSEGLRTIAERVAGFTGALAERLAAGGCELLADRFFDTVRVRPSDGQPAEAVLAAARAKRINLRDFGDGTVGIAFDETVETEDVVDVLACFGVAADAAESFDSHAFLPDARRTADEYLSHPVFHRHRSETELLRYLYRLQQKDLSLATAMIPLGSCTMKLNATAEMAPISWSGFAELHPFAPLDQADGYRELFERLESWLRSITGFAAMSLQPNAGSQGEYAGLLAIRGYHDARGETDRRVCLIPSSAHGTNAASAVLAGLDVKVVGCDDDGNVDVADLRDKAAAAGDRLAALMITYPSTHGVFEPTIKEIARIVHEHGGQVYVDGANLNALVGLSRLAELGGDVCHLNLHKTFCIPHGGGGPGMGPIGVAEHLIPHLPGHSLVPHAGAGAAVSAAPWGSPDDPADLVRLHRDDGRGRADQGDAGGDPRRELRREAPRGPLRGALPRPRRLGGARVHCGRPAAQEARRRRRRRRGEAAHGLRLPRADDVVAGGGHADGRTDREREPGRDRSILRRDDRDPRRGACDRRRTVAAG